MTFVGGWSSFQAIATPASDDAPAVEAGLTPQETEQRLDELVATASQQTNSADGRPKTRERSGA